MKRQHRSAGSSAYAEPTPQELTQRVLDVSVTELGQFRSCRRRWSLETLQNLERKTPSLYADFGTGIHHALERLYLGLDDHHLFLDYWYNNMINELDHDEVPPEVMDELQDLRDLGHVMLDNYELYDATASVQLGEVLAVEGRFIGKRIAAQPPSGYEDVKVDWQESGRVIVPIVHPVTKKPIQHDNGAVPCLSARIDLLTQRKTPHKGLWVVDHKTSGTQPSDRGWDFDEQCTGYCYTVWRWTGVIPRGVIANYLMRDEPKPPRYVQSRKKNEEVVLSTAKDQLTTPDLYRAALIEDGYMRNGQVTSEKHAACLAALLERGWDPFFQRIEVTRNEYELMAFEERLYTQYHDMLVASQSDEQLYPNQSRWWCPSCSVNRICQAMEDGSDYVDVAAHQYRVGKDRKAA